MFEFLIFTYTYDFFCLLFVIIKVDLKIVTRNEILDISKMERQQNSQVKWSVYFVVKSTLPKFESEKSVWISKSPKIIPQPTTIQKSEIMKTHYLAIIF